MESFFELYELHKSTEDLTDRFKKDPTGKTCKFCKNTNPNVSFNTVPHIVPELFGRNNKTSNFECDSCNSRFQKFESDTSTMIQHYLSLINVKTKNGVPTFQSIKGYESYSTTLKSINNKTNLNFGRNLTDFKFNDEDKTLTINFRTRKFSPYSVYKTFLKMGISLLTDDELESNSHYIEFLNSETPITNGMQVWKTFRYILKTKYYSIPKVDLYKAKEIVINGEEFPEYVIIINFANIIFQFFLPISIRNMQEHKEENKLKLIAFPYFVLENITKVKQVESYDFDLDETNKISITDKIILHYDKLEPTTE